jgi:signal transduction histidine kinase/CheY-like chemotaxis protein
MAQGLSSLTLRRLLFVVGALIVSVNLLSAIWDLRNSRAVVEREALRDFNNMTAVLADQTARSLESVRILLHQVSVEIARGGVGDPEFRAQRLRDRISGFPRIRAVLVLDRDGHIAASSDPASGLGTDYSDRAYFTQHERERIDGAYVSPPFVGRLSGHSSFALSERLAGPNGEFAGVVAAIIDTTYMDRLYQSLDVGPSGFVSLWNLEGTLVTRVPPREDLIGRPAALPPALAAALRNDNSYSGWAPAVAAGDQVLIGMARVPESPLIVAVGARESDVLAPWHRESARVMVRTLATTAFMLALVWLASRELTRRETAERSVRAEREQLQQRLRQSEKMEAVGRLAGGIAHDFNNILGGIMGYAEMLLEDLPEGSAEHRYAHNLFVSAQRARDLVEQILTYSRAAKVARRPVELGRIVRETLDVVRGSMPTGITIEGGIPAAPAVTCGDETQLHEVVMNLCTNAIQAMGEQGTLTVRLETADLAGGVTLSHGALGAGNYLKLAVGDTGSGMDETTIAHIFEPFFTTKEVGKGTGLGLATVYGIVADSGGAIDVRSRRGEGSWFEIYLPRTEQAPAAEPKRGEPVPRGDAQRILLVDDEVPLLNVMAELLRRLGYEPEPFSDPHAAVAAFDAQPAAYDLVLTDEAMPGMPGTALAREVRRARDDIPVLIVTGRAEEAFTRAAAEAGVREVLLKPVQSRELAAALARHLPAEATHTAA